MATFSNDWKLLPDLPAARSVHGIALDGNRIFMVAGKRGPGTIVQGNYVSDIETATIQSDGSIGSWKTVGAMPILPPINLDTGNVNAVAARGFLHLIGGDGQTEYISWTKLGAEGTIGPIKSVKLWTSGNFSALNAAVLDDYIYVVSGNSPGGVNGCYSFKLGQESSMDFTPPYPPSQPFTLDGNSIPHNAVAAYNGYVYSFGGVINGVNTVFGTISSAKVQDGKVVGPWTHVGDMTVPRFRHGVSVLPDGTVVIAGGCTGFAAATATASTEYAQLGPNGTIGQMRVGPPMMAPIRNVRMVYFNGRLYVLGGSSPGNAAVATVQSLRVL